MCTADSVTATHVFRRRCCCAQALPELPADDTDIGTQLVHAMREHPEISRDRVLSEIGILFVEGFETTGEAKPAKPPPPSLFQSRQLLCAIWSFSQI
jgi:hypothetical protein